MSWSVRANRAGDAVISFSGEDDVVLAGAKLSQVQITSDWFVPV